MSQEEIEFFEDPEFGIEFGEQTRMELTEAEQEFLRVLDQEQGLEKKSS